MNAGLPELSLNFHGRIIEHLGIQMYQKPVSAIAEIIANAWDADAEVVDVVLPDDLTETSEVIVRDNGDGMTLKECQDRYLNAGLCRRGDDPNESTTRGRPVLGRKGIGKFAGFGIAKVIRVTTISASTGERTRFEMDIDELTSDEYVAQGKKPVSVLEYSLPDDSKREDHGTEIALCNLLVTRRPSEGVFLRSMARRFLLHQRAADFAVRVNGAELPTTEDLENVQFTFPRDFQEDEVPEALASVDDGWAEEVLANGERIKWKVNFYKTPIDQEELRGISVFANGKLAQDPFFFNLRGGIGGQHGLEYMSGQVQADYVDGFSSDPIATERQRINFELEETQPLEEWGKKRVKELVLIWKERRADAQRRMIEDKLAGFSERLERLRPGERKTVRSALNRLCRISSLTNEQFNELGGAILLAWEHGRLHELIQDIADLEDLTEADLLGALVEAQVLTALNTAEAVKTKLLTVGGLKLRIQERQLEKAVRDFIAGNPWLISPVWETFAAERTVRKLTEDCAQDAGMTGGDWEGRIDLALSSGRHLLAIEFMRPGIRVDWDHVDRFDRYVRLLRENIDARTGGKFDRVSGYLVADDLVRDAALAGRIKDLELDDKLAMTWDDILGRAISTWREFLVTLVGRAPEDPRLEALLEYLPE